MLHKINFPETCRPFFEWIVDLQRQLITTLCQEPVDDVDEINEDWLFGRVSKNLEVDREWFGRFCNWKRKREEQSLLECAHSIVVFSAEIKARLLADFENDYTFELLFDPEVRNANNLVGITLLKAIDLQVAEVVHRFFESFYDPALYRGYRIFVENKLANFDRGKFAQEFTDANPKVCVCPMCDGDFGNAKVDHFYPKAVYPYLSCHPHNLVPICEACNGTGGKYETPPLSLDAVGYQTDDWFHPYLRSAAGIFSITFQRLKDGPTPVLTSDDEKIKARLDNLTKLLNLSGRWRTALSLKMRIAQNHVRRARNDLGRPLTEAELCNKLTEWATSAEDEIGLESFALVKTEYFRSAAQRDSVLFDELWIYNAPDLDAVTAANI